MNLQVAFPSATPGAMVDLKKGRATIAFTQAEITFAMNLFTVLLMTPRSIDAPVPGAGAFEMNEASA